MDKCRTSTYKPRDSKIEVIDNIFWSMKNIANLFILLGYS